MKRGFLLFFTVMVVLWIAGSCKSSSHAAAAVVELDRQVAIDSFLFEDSIILISRSYYDRLLRCGQNTESPSKTPLIHVSYFWAERYIDDCLKKKVFAGDRSAEPFLIEFLKSRKDVLWQYKAEGYRGEKVFLTILDLAATINCRDDDYNTPLGRMPLQAAKEMIKSFGGYTKFRDFKKNTDLLSQIKRNSNEDFPCYRAASVINDQRLLEKAWEEGQIVLKDYGEE